MEVFIVQTGSLFSPQREMCQEQQQSLMPFEVWQYDLVSLVPAQISFSTSIRCASGLAIIDFECFCSVSHMQLGKWISVQSSSRDICC